MIKLPFFNRERYVVIKAYTFDRLVHKDKILAMTGTSVGVLNRCPKSSPTGVYDSDFSTCYGINAAMNRSLTLSSWSEVNVEYQTESDKYPDHTVPPMNEVFVVANVIDDKVYKKQPDARIYKMLAPWMITCNKDINFVMSRHMMNELPMNVPTGILHFEATKAPHLFHILYPGQKYKIPYRHPLAQIFPLTDLPIHLETYWDAQMFQGLFDTRHNIPYFRANGIKVVNNQIKK